jgi:hypothetical protein
MPLEKLEQLAAQLKELSEALTNEKTSKLTASRGRRVRKTIGEAYERLRKGHGKP